MTGKATEGLVQHGIAKSGAKVQISTLLLLSRQKRILFVFFLNLLHKNSFWLAFVQNLSFQP
jgi:hypothetical protein